MITGTVGQKDFEEFDRLQSSKFEDENYEVDLDLIDLQWGYVSWLTIDDPYELDYLLDEVEANRFPDDVVEAVLADRLGDVSQVADALRDGLWTVCETARDVAVCCLGEDVAGRILNSYISSNVDWDGVVDDLHAGSTILELSRGRYLVM